MREAIGPYKFRDEQRRELVKSGILPISSNASREIHLIRKFTVDEYMRMAEAGILIPEDQVELADGVIWEMAPTGRPHGRRTHSVARLLGRILPEEIEISVKSTIRLDDCTGPEPGIALLSQQASLDNENIPNPEGVLLVIEISDSTRRAGRGEKARRYAQSGIPELWVFMLGIEEIEVHRQPVPDGYADVRRYRRGDALTIQALPGILVTADELLQ